MPVAEGRRENLRDNSIRYAAKRKTQGEVRVAVWVPAHRADALKAYAAKLRVEAGTERAPQKPPPSLTVPKPPSAQRPVRQHAKTAVQTATEIAASPARDDITHADITAFARRHGITPAKVGRNEPCPCGSGKKYKRCCWGTERVSLALGGGGAPTHEH